MKAITALLLALLLYGLLGLAAGWGVVSRDLASLPPWLWLAALAVVGLGHGLLFCRWQLYLAQLGHRLPVSASLPIYGAGLGLIMAPGRSGEALRGLWLQRRHGIPLRIGVAATAGERLVDLISALLVLGWGLGGQQLPGVGLALLLLALLAWGISHPQAVQRLETWLGPPVLRGPGALQRRWHGLHRVLWEAIQALEGLRRVLRPKPLLAGLSFTISVWLLESWLVQQLLAALGAPVSLGAAGVIRTATSLGGALSLLPAGLGSSELTSVGLSILYGASQSQAVAATFVLRLVTLALPALLGAACLLLQPDLRRLSR